MSFIFSVLAAICAILGVYLFLVDANLVEQIGSFVQTFLALIESQNAPFAKGVVLLTLALAFGIVAIIFDRQKRGVASDPAKK